MGVRVSPWLLLLVVCNANDTHCGWTSVLRGLISLASRVRPPDPRLAVFKAKLQLDGEKEIMPRFERGGPGSSPGRAAHSKIYGAGGVAASACLAVNQEVRVRLPSRTLSPRS